LSGKGQILLRYPRTSSRAAPRPASDLLTSKLDSVMEFGLSRTI